jgi:hypothetical protein
VESGDCFSAEEKPMKTHVHKTAQLGELIVTAFDSAARYSRDPQEVSRLATQAVALMLRRARRTFDSTVTANHMTTGADRSLGT